MVSWIEKTASTGHLSVDLAIGLLRVEVPPRSQIFSSFSSWVAPFLGLSMFPSSMLRFLIPLNELDATITMLNHWEVILKEVRNATATMLQPGEVILKVVSSLKPAQIPNPF